MKLSIWQLVFFTFWFLVTQCIAWWCATKASNAFMEYLKSRRER